MDERVLKDDDFLVSQTDEKGIILFANEDFCEVAGYSLDELIGQPHNIVRHKDMPKAAFKNLWETVKSGKVWNGYVKNAIKGGGYYWVYASVYPKYDSVSQRNTYISCRRKASTKEIADAQKLYKTMQ
ncbi:MAG: PAS domain-containing protein [Campylobacterales bacterium]|nr:PAS domain-containing protein [Campylobacterales bacterium]